MNLSPTNYPYLAAYIGPEQAAQGDLGDAVQARLAGELRGMIAALAAYIPARLVNSQLADPQPGRVGGAFWQGSLLFADLSGFTALSEKLSVLGRQGAEEVSAVINQVFDGLITEVAHHQGMLLKFGGDALTAFFDEQAIGLSHASAATSAALAMQRRMAAFDYLETRAGTFRLGLRVGVHSGRAFAAEVGDESHIELVITGAEVNRVALAQEIAEPGEVVITEQTAELLKGASLTPREAGFHHVRSLLFYSLPPAPPDPLALTGPADLATLDHLARQLAALRPYLVRNLPRRFLEPATTSLGEFRPVSVLFANFHNFSAMLEQFGDDPNTAAALLNAYYRRAQAVVHHYDGIVNKVDMYTHGDKLMALFGAPAAHEDDPLRAVRCALELEQALAEANSEIGDLLNGRRWTAASKDGLLDTSTVHRPPSTVFVQKIGINTGTVFAGRVGGAARYEYTVMGPAVNLAARLMSAAKDGMVMLSPTTRAAVAHQITVQELEPLRLKGLAEPVIPARALAGPSAGKRQQSALLPITPLIGRDEELHALREAAVIALNGAGRVLAIVGDAGTGKSRLGEELIRELVLVSNEPADQGGVPSFNLSTANCQSYEQMTPYAALRPLLRYLLRLDGSQNDQRDIAAVVAMIDERITQLAPALLRFGPLLGDALGMGLPDTPLTAALTPQQRHDRLHELLGALLIGDARETPTLLLIEDLHWADSQSQELLARLSTEVNATPLLMILNYRLDPPIAEPWCDQPDTLRLLLSELSDESSGALLAGLLDGHALAEMRMLIERTQGNPYFIEELVRTLIESAALERDAGGAWHFTTPLDQVSLPTSIEGLLLTRLDRLDEPRHELIQVAAVVGRRFALPVVAGVYGDNAPLGEGLERLIVAEMIALDHQERELAYLFRHALLRDVAYEGILYARRRSLHSRVARRIEQIYADSLDGYLPLLAYHYLRAEEWAPAFTYHRAAGLQARSRFANRDALAMLQTALDIARRQLADHVTPPTLAELYEWRGDLFLLLGEYEQAEAAYADALALLDPANDEQLEVCVRLHRLTASVYEHRSEYEAALARLETGLVLAGNAAPLERARCVILRAGIRFRRSEYESAMEDAQAGRTLAVALASSADEAHALRLMGSLWQNRGDLNASIEALEEARELFERLNDITQLSSTLNNLGMVHLQVGRWRDTVNYYERSLAISENIGDVQAMARTSNNLAVVLVGRNQLERAADLYRYSSEQFRRIGSSLGVAVTTYNRGEVLLLRGQPQEALALFEESLAILERIQARSFMPEVLRLAAEATLALGRLADARRLAERSLVIAGGLGVPADEAVARRVLGQIALSEADLATATTLLDESRAALERLDNRYELGKTLYWLAQLAYARGDIAAAALLDTSAAIFADLDAQRDLAIVQHTRDSWRLWTMDGKR